MLRLRCLVLLSTGVLGLAGTEVSAASRPSVPELAGTTTVSTTGPSGRVVVRIPRQVRLPGGSRCALSDSLRASGSARHSLLFLTSLPASAQSRIIWLGRTTFGQVVRSYDSECLSTSIPAGTYLLQHVHTTGSSTMRFSLPGLRGTTTVRTAGDAATVRELPPVIATAAAPATYSWGTRGDLPSRGSVLTLGTFTGRPDLSGSVVAGDCLLREEAAALPDEVAYAPGCPAGSSGTYQGTSGVETWSATITSNLPPGSYGAGFWYAGTPTHAPRGAVSVWLPNLAPAR